MANRPTAMPPDSPLPDGSLDLADMDTTTPLDVALSSYLAKRASQARAGRGAGG